MSHRSSTRLHHSRPRVSRACILALALLGALLAGVASASADPPTGANVPIGIRLFPADNPWNQDVSSLPVDPNSSVYLSSVGLGEPLHPDFGTVWDGAPNGIPYVVVRGTQPKVPITFYYADESDPGPYPIPLDAPIEGGPASDGDRHILTLDIDNHVLYEVYDAHYSAATGQWIAGSGAIWNLGSNALRPDGWTSADAAGLPMLPGLVRYDEVSAGAIDHALRFTVPDTQRAYVFPASHFASDSTDPALPPMGLRVRLKAGYDISRFPPEVQVVLRALKKYGMIVADNGGPFYISGAPDPRWDDDALHEITAVTGRDLEVVETTGTDTLPNPTPPVAPVVQLGGTVRVRVNKSFSRTGSFTDPQGTRWVATVNYGDGTGTKRLSVGKGKRLALKHAYKRKSTRYVTVRVTSSTGLTGVAQLKVVVAR